MNKDLNEILKAAVLKQSLLRASVDRVALKRKELWLQILGVDKQYIRGEYELYHQQSQLELSKQVHEKIDVDVVRSFNSLKEISQDTLKNILKTYAIVNPNLDYCQGMNFIAGFLYMILGKEESYAFAVLREIIERFQMTMLYNTELPMLKLLFY